MTAPFPFLVGCGRSGTTLLRAMLDAHPDLTVPGESYFIEQLTQRRDGYQSGAGFDRAAFERDLFSDYRFRAWNLDPEQVRRELDAAGSLDLAEAVRATYRAVAAKMGTSRYADKTPSYALCMPTIAALLPEAVFVHLVRDPRDVVASYLSASWGPRTLAGAADTWRRRAGAARRHGVSLGPSRYREIRYEDLVADPARELAAICEFIELDFDPAMLAYQDGPVVRRSVGMEAGAHTALRERPTVGIRDWRVDMERHDAARIGALVDPLAVEFGYEPSPACRGVNRLRHLVGSSALVIDRTSLAFRRTRFANRLRGPWRRFRRRASLSQMGIPAEGVS